jgi:hypothetical protein
MLVSKQETTRALGVATLMSFIFDSILTFSTEKVSKLKQIKLKFN